MDSYYVYFLKSSNVDRYYIGVSKNTDGRLIKHNKGSTRSTKPYRPWTLIYREKFAVKREAYKREWFLKHPKGYMDKLAIIEQYG